MKISDTFHQKLFYLLKQWVKDRHSPVSKTLYLLIKTYYLLFSLPRQWISPKYNISSTVKKRSPKKKEGSLHILMPLHTNPFINQGGTESYTLHLSRELIKIGHKVTILFTSAYRYKPSLHFYSSSIDKINIIELNLPFRKKYSTSGYDEKLDAPFKALLQASDFDLIHFQHLLGLSSSWVTIAKECAIPTGITLHDQFVFCPRVHTMHTNGSYCSKGPETIEKCTECLQFNKSSIKDRGKYKLQTELRQRKENLTLLFKNIDYIHSFSHHLKENCIRHGLNNDNFHIIPPSITPFTVNKKEIKKNQKIRVAFAGRISILKGIFIYLRAIDEFLRKLNKKEPNTIEFFIYGTSQNQDIHQKILQHIQKTPCIHYKGPFSSNDRAQLFSEIDVLVTPSLSENYPFILQEALHARVPAIASNVGGVTEIIHNGKNGFIIEPGDTAALADIFLKIEKNPDCLDKLEMINEQEITPSDHTEKMLKLFQDALQKRRRN